MLLHQKLGINTDERRIVSICGAGGKTSLMYALARESCKKSPTAIFTTTHSYPPEGPDVVWSHPLSPEECMQCWSRGMIVAAGEPLHENRLAIPRDKELCWLLNSASAVYIEADGSRRLPLKYPDRSREPVVLPETTQTVVIAGLSALGLRPEEGLHRFTLAGQETGYHEERISPEGMADILWSGYHSYDPIFLLNQADTPELIQAGERISELLLAKGARRAITLSLRQMGMAWLPSSHCMP